jgi:hypothetical protein
MTARIIDRHRRIQPAIVIRAHQHDRHAVMIRPAHAKGGRG